MAFKLFKRLRQQDPETLSPQLQSNLSNMADRVRFREFRRTQGRAGVTGPFGFTAGRTAPIPNQIAAGRISSRLGTDFGSELNRLTAPDPATFARGERAPEFIGQELELGRTGISEAELRNRGTEIDLGFRPEQLQQGLDVGELGLRTDEQKLLEREQLFPSELETAQQAPQRGQLDIDRLTREGAGAPTAGQKSTVDQLTHLAKEARDEGLTDKANEIERAIFEIQSGVRDPASIGGGTLGPGGVGPPAPGLGLFGAPASTMAPSGRQVGSAPAAQTIRTLENEDAVMLESFGEGFFDDLGGGPEQTMGLGGIGGQGLLVINSDRLERKLEQIVFAIENAPPNKRSLLINGIRKKMAGLEGVRPFGNPWTNRAKNVVRLLDEIESLTGAPNLGAPVTGAGGAPPVR